MCVTWASIAAGQVDMRAPMRSVILILSFLVVSTGCKTTGGKIFGTLSLASAVGGGYLTATSSATIENGMLVTHNDRQNVGVGLIFAAALAATGWAVCEIMFSEHGCGSGGGYSYVPSAPVVARVAPAAPTPPAPPVAPAPSVAPSAPFAPSAPSAPSAPPAPSALLVDPADPAVVPAPVGERAFGEPVVIAVQGRGSDERDLFIRGWRFDPLDGQDKLYAPSGEFIGRIDARGDVWDRKGALVGRVAMGPSCEISCMRSQAGKMLRGIPLNR